MQHKIILTLLPQEAEEVEQIRAKIFEKKPAWKQGYTGHKILKKSLDARGRKIVFQLQILVYIREPVPDLLTDYFTAKPSSRFSKKVVIIGAGPTGLFAALQLLQLGIQPIVLERGKDVRSRRRDLAILNKSGEVNEESNYCFGEGGAGTYSDGKLYTRSRKRGNIDGILQRFVQFGAPEQILYEAHPHIGTNKLPQIITSMRQAIVANGGVFLFEKKVTDFIHRNHKIESVVTADGDHFSADAFILATGHSARDIFELLLQKQIRIEAKPFALGVRIEHPQALIDQIQYKLRRGDPKRPENLPPASYSLVAEVNERAVFSFCMCPGGIIAPAATAPGELVVNGWSPSKRNNPFANSGMVVQVSAEDAYRYLKTIPEFKPLTPQHPLLTLYFQQTIERFAYAAGGGKFVAPAQRMEDFIQRKTSANLPKNSYLPGLASADLSQVLPEFIYHSLAEGCKIFGKKLKGYLSNEAVLVATESRTSSPVRIPRNENLHHPEYNNLYPAGEGAGYAGGIVSAAMDGERVARQISKIFIEMNR